MAWTGRRPVGSPSPPYAGGGDLAGLAAASPKTKTSKNSPLTHYDLTEAAKRKYGAPVSAKKSSGRRPAGISQEDAREIAAATRKIGPVLKHKKGIKGHDKFGRPLNDTVTKLERQLESLQGELNRVGKTLFGSNKKYKNFIAGSMNQAEFKQIRSTNPRLANRMDDIMGRIALTQTGIMNEVMRLDDAETAYKEKRKAARKKKKK